MFKPFGDIVSLRGRVAAGFYHDEGTIWVLFSMDAHGRS